MGAYCVGLLFLAVLSAQDIKEKKVSIYKLLIFALIAVIYRIFIRQLYWQEILGDVLPGCMLLLLSLLTKEEIGYGDGMTLIVLGLWLGGWFIFHVLCLGIMLSGIYAVFCLMKGKKDAIPLIPFFLAGMEVALVYV